jgi:hypothetical protein
MQRSRLTKRQRYEEERAAMDLVRATFIPTWRSVADFILPMRPRFLISDNQRGQRRNQKIIDSTATFAAGTLTAGLTSGMAGPSKPWYRLTTSDPAINEQEAVKIYLQTVVQLMTTVFLKSNLYDILPQLYSDTGVFGTGVIGVFDDDEDVIRCVSFPIGSYWLALDAKNRVRVFLREFQMTTRQIVEEFGGEDAEPDWSKFSLAVKTAWQTKQYGQKFDVIHVVSPNEDHDDSKLHSKYKRFAACYYEKGTPDGQNQPGSAAIFLREEGFDEFPILAGRWDVSGDDVYATSCPGLVALGDIQQLQTQEKRGAQALEKMINPPLVGPPELQRVAVTQLPGGITYLAERDGVKGLRPLHEITNFHLADLEAKNEQKRGLINRAFFADLFLMLDSMDAQTAGAQPKTAEEIRAREREKLMVLGPVLERYNKDVFSQLIDRTFAIMLRKGMLPEAPPELQGMTLRVEYISIMAQAQKIQSLGTLERFTSYITNLVTVTQRPDVLDKWDMDQTIDAYADSAGIDPHLIVPDDKVAEIRQARAKQQAAQQQAQQLATVAPAVNQLAGADTSGKNALTDLAGAMAGGGMQGAA